MTATASASNPLTTVQIGPYTQVFAGSVPTDPVQASVINSFREAQVLYNKSLLAQHLVAPVTQFIISRALLDLNGAITVDKQQGLAISGTDQLFLTKIANLSANSATVTTCDNQSKLTIVNALPNPPDKVYLLENWRMVRHSGHWAIWSLSIISLPDPRAQVCQP